MARDDGTSSRHADDKARFKQYDYMAVRVDKELYLYYTRMYGVLREVGWNGVVVNVFANMGGCLVFCLVAGVFLYPFLSPIDDRLVNI